MPDRLAAELLVERLIDWGVDTVFGLPGDGINGIMEALRRHKDQIRFLLVHHEEAAAFMACGHAKQTGRLGVCVATSGPGGIHLLNGLYDAKLDHQPVLAITGTQPTSVLGTEFQQEVHLEKAFIDVARYDMLITNPVSITTANAVSSIPFDTSEIRAKQSSRSSSVRSGRFRTSMRRLRTAPWRAKDCQIAT